MSSLRRRRNKICHVCDEEGNTDKSEINGGNIDVMSEMKEGNIDVMSEMKEGNKDVMSEIKEGNRGHVLDEGRKYIYHV